jgi:hypothetical protein
MLFLTYISLQFQTIGIDSEFCIVESLVTGIVDMWPEKLRYLPAQSETVLQFAAQSKTVLQFAAQSKTVLQFAA